MNRIRAVVTDIKSVDNINVVTFEAAGQTMRMMALELNNTLGIGSEVLLGAKATNIALCKSINSLLSISNQLEVSIESIEHGKLLSSVKFNFAGSVLESIITRESASHMALQAGETIVALIKSSELSIMKIL